MSNETYYPSISNRFVNKNYDKNSGTEKPTPIGMTGMVNLGNSQYISTILQVFSNVRLVRYYILSDRYKKDINQENPLSAKGEVIENFAEVIKMLLSGKYNNINIREFKSTIGKHIPAFAGYSFHLPSEFFYNLLNTLHEEVNLIKNKPIFSKVEYNPDEVEMAKESWSVYQKRNLSFFADNFFFLLRVEMICDVCGFKEISFQPTEYLRLKTEKSNQLSDMIRDFQTPYFTDPKNSWYCPKCEEHIKAKVKKTIHSLPRYLSIIVKPIAEETGGFFYPTSPRISHPHSFEVNDQDNFQVLQQVPRFSIYKLFGIVYHLGGFGGGHDVVDARLPCDELTKIEDEKWVNYDDISTTEITNPFLKEEQQQKEVIESKNVLMLFYEGITVKLPDNKELRNERIQFIMENKLELSIENEHIFLICLLGDVKVKGLKVLFL